MLNAFYYYAPRVMEEAGLGDESALLSTIGIGVVNVLFTLAGVALIDRIGRKLLMYICSFGYILSLGGVSLAFGGPRLAGAGGAGVLRPLRGRARDRSGHGHLGLHQRDLSQSPEGGRPIVRELRPLGPGGHRALAGARRVQHDRSRPRSTRSSASSPACSWCS